MPKQTKQKKKRGRPRARFKVGDWVKSARDARINDTEPGSLHKISGRYFRDGMWWYRISGTVMGYGDCWFEPITVSAPEPEPEPEPEPKPEPEPEPEQPLNKQDESQDGSIYLRVINGKVDVRVYGLSDDEVREALMVAMEIMVDRDEQKC